MARHRALLIGASDYEMRGVSSLPFIPGDLARLGSALEERGFDEVQVLAGREGGKQVSANYVNGRVAGFLRRARPGDTLLVLLSGHGVHARGRDYLVPEDIDEDTHPFESGCVAIDWRDHLDETPASQVVFLIDACREGIEQESMGVASVKQWSRQKVSAALRRKVAYVYACSPAQLALFVRPQDSPVNPVAGVRPGESFSIFSRSVSDVITAHSDAAALPLGQFKDAVQDRMAELHRAYRKSGQPQTLRIVTDIPSDGFYFLPPPRERSTHASQPSTTGANSDTTMHESPAMSVRAGTPEPTRLPTGTRTGWRVLPVLAVLSLLAGAVWAAVTYNSNDKDIRAKSNRAGSGISHTPTSSGTQSSSKDVETSSSGSGGGKNKVPNGSTLPVCIASNVTLTLRSVHNSYSPDQTPAFQLDAKNSSGNDCKLDLGPKSAVLAITQTGSDTEIWSSADCPSGSGSLLFRVPANAHFTYTVNWDRKPSAPNCSTPPAGSASAGTYLVEAKVPGFPKAQASFVLSAD
ncbi:caspase family protein [Streptomyces sp. NPDC003710]